MTTDPRLERYLSSLERALKAFPAGDRAEIITEIKSHVLSALEQDPETGLDHVLGALGEPETVANRYLIERGMKTTRPSISPIVKWLVIGFLGTFAMLLIFAGFVLSQFSPMVQVSDKDDKVTLLGGLIEVGDDKGNFYIRGRNQREIEGTLPTTTGQALLFKFGNGKVEVANSDEPVFTWNCRVKGEGDVAPVTSGTQSTLDLTNFRGVSCDLAVPRGMKFSLDGQNGKVEFSDPRFAVNASLNNGSVVFDADDQEAYRYDIKVSNGKTDTFESSDKPEAHEIQIRLNNGKISRED